jgi:hypothetical protein
MRCAREAAAERARADEQWRRALTARPPFSPVTVTPAATSSTSSSSSSPPPLPPLASLRVASWNIADFSGDGDGDCFRLVSAEAPAGFSVEDNRVALACELAAADADIVCLQEAAVAGAGGGGVRSGGGRRLGDGGGGGGAADGDDDARWPLRNEAGALACAGEGGLCPACRRCHAPLRATHVRTLSAPSHAGHVHLLLRRSLMARVTRLFAWGPDADAGGSYGGGYGSGAEGAGVPAVGVSLALGGGGGGGGGGAEIVDIVTMHMAPGKGGAAARSAQLREMVRCLHQRPAAAAGAGNAAMGAAPAALLLGDANWRNGETKQLRVLPLPSAAAAPPPAAAAAAAAAAAGGAGSAAAAAQALFAAPPPRKRPRKAAAAGTAAAAAAAGDVLREVCLPPRTNTWDSQRNGYHGRGGFEFACNFDRCFVREGRRAASGGGGGDGGGPLLRVAAASEGAAAAGEGGLRLLGAQPVDAGGNHRFWLSDHFGLLLDVAFETTTHTALPNGAAAAAAAAAVAAAPVAAAAAPAAPVAPAAPKEEEEGGKSSATNAKKSRLLLVESSDSDDSDAGLAGLL